MVNRMPSLSRILALLLASMVFLLSCTKPQEPKQNQSSVEKVSLKIGTQPWIGYGPWWIAERQGIFSRYNLAVELVNFTTDQDLNSALAANQIQAGNLATHTALKLISTHGVPIKLVLLLDESHEADAIIAKDIRSITELRGKKIAFEEGTTSDILLRYALKAHGLSLADIEPVPMPAADAGAAAVAGAVDAAVTYEPYITTALRGQEGFKIVYSGADAPGLISDFLVVRQDFSQKYPEAVRSLMKIWEESLAYWQANQEQGNEIIAKAVGLQPEELDPILKGLKFYNLADNRRAYQDGSLYSSLKSLGNILIEQGVLTQLPKLEDVIDFSFQQ